MRPTLGNTGFLPHVISFPDPSIRGRRANIPSDFSPPDQITRTKITVTEPLGSGGTGAKSGAKVQNSIIQPPFFYAEQRCKKGVYYRANVCMAMVSIRRQFMTTHCSFSIESCFGTIVMVCMVRG